ncbi:MAG: hypothetical protein K1X44_05780 [Alphaproteobacteria bacterium]|nr:hypothetical protein [Alphaproteobacteria bacterium]
MMNDLPIHDAYKETLRTSLHIIKDCPTILFLGLWASFFYFIYLCFLSYPFDQITIETNNNISTLIFGSILNLFLLAPFNVAVHRWIFGNEYPTHNFFHLFYRSLELRYFIAILVTSLLLFTGSSALLWAFSNLIGISSLIHKSIFSLSVVAIFLGSIYCNFVFWLLLTSIAIEKKDIFNFRTTFKLIKPLFWRILLVLILLITTLLFLVFVLAFIISSFISILHINSDSSTLILNFTEIVFTSFIPVLLMLIYTVYYTKLYQFIFMSAKSNEPEL